MKKIMVCCLLSFVFLSASYAQYRTERTGYEGDFFSLEGALDLFKQSHTLRDFERQLNTQENWVNNLDLNYDGRIDYIRVEHLRQGNFHAIVLQALLGRYDIQDVAVIEIEIIGRGEAILQIVGDEDLYGEEVFVEPIAGYADSRGGRQSDYGGYVNVYYWRPVQYILGRQYRVYASPYRWAYYPTWWSPWVQITWNVFRPRIVVYHRHYHVVRRHRVIRVHNFYRSHRSYCPTVVQRANTVRISQGRAPIYRPEPAGRRRSAGYYQGSNNSVERQRDASRPGASGQSPSVSRKRTEPSTQGSETRSRTPQADQRSRRSADRPGVSPSSPARPSPSVSRESSRSSTQSGDVRSRAPQADQRSRRSADQPGASRSDPSSRTSRQGSSVSGKKTEPSPQRGEVRSRNSQADQRSRRSADRPRTSPSSRSSGVSSPSPSASKKNAPAHQNGTRSTNREKGSAGSGARSRKGGGN